MKLLITLILLLNLPMAGSIVYAQNRSIQFEHGSFEESMAKAKATGRPLFFDAYTSWCIPCQMMAKQVFTLDSVADYFNSHFVNVKFDMEKGEGVALCKKYMITAYPTYFILDTSGAELYRLLGSRPAPEFMAGVQSFSDDRPVMDLQTKFRARVRDKAFLIQALGTLFVGNHYTMLDEWLMQLDKEEGTDKEIWSFFKTARNKKDGRAFQFILQHKAIFISKLGTEKMESYFAECYDPYIFHYLAVTREPDAAYFKELKANIKRDITSKEIREPLLAKANMAEARTEKDVVKMISIYKASFTEEFIGNRCFSLQYLAECAREFGTLPQCEETLAYVSAEVKRMNEPNMEQLFESKTLGPLRSHIETLR